MPVTGNNSLSLKERDKYLNVNTEQYTQHTLSIRLSADGFSFSVTSNTEKEAFQYETLRIQPNISLTANIKQFLQPIELLKQQFKHINILIDTPHYTTVPFELFEDEQTEAIYNHCHPQRLGEKVLYNILDRCNIVVLFAIDKSTYSLLKELYPQARIFASISPIIEHLAGKSRIGTNSKTFLHLNRRTTDILVFAHRQPLLVNTFSTQGSSDCSYYTLSIWEKLKLSQEYDELYLIGNQPHKEQVAEELRTYIKSVSILNPMAEFNRSAAASNGEISYDLLSLIHTNL